MIREVYDEENQITFKMLFACACGEQVIDLGDEFFECLHCDRPCAFAECHHCATLMLVDYDEEGDEDESDI